MVVNKGNTQWRQRESRQVKYQDCWKDKWMDGQIDRHFSLHPHKRACCRRGVTTRTHG